MSARALKVARLRSRAAEAEVAEPASRPQEQPRVDDQSPPKGQQDLDALVDGKRVKIVGADEIVLECGSASITLRRNGKVIIRGAYVETRSEGTNRIKGAAVRIN